MSTENESLARLLRMAARSFETELTRELHRRGYADVSLADSALFAHLDPEGTRASELARRAGVTRQSMGELVADLVRKGYLAQRPDASDRRAKIVVLTEAGRRLDREATQAIADLEAEYRRELGDERVEALRESLAAVGARLRR